MRLREVVLLAWLLLLLLLLLPLPESVRLGGATHSRTASALLVSPIFAALCPVFLHCCCLCLLGSSCILSNRRTAGCSVGAIFPRRALPE
jgi:hypothetical protein